MRREKEGLRGLRQKLSRENDCVHVYLFIKNTINDYLKLVQIKIKTKKIS